jgi:hypothetical protein
MSLPNFYLGCESQEMSLKPLKNRDKNPSRNFCREVSLNLRNRSIQPEQNALCRGIQGPWTETPAIRQTRGEAPGEMAEAMGTSRVADFRPLRRRPARRGIATALPPNGAHLFRLRRWGDDSSRRKTGFSEKYHLTSPP